MFTVFPHHVTGWNQIATNPAKLHQELCCPQSPASVPWRGYQTLVRCPVTALRLRAKLPRRDQCADSWLHFYWSTAGEGAWDGNVSCFSVIREIFRKTRPLLWVLERRRMWSRPCFLSPGGESRGKQLVNERMAGQDSSWRLSHGQSAGALLRPTTV